MVHDGGVRTTLKRKHSARPQRNLEREEDEKQPLFQSLSSFYQGEESNNKKSPSAELMEQNSGQQHNTDAVQGNSQLWIDSI